jgi:hypothetical protein
MRVEFQLEGLDLTELSMPLEQLDVSWSLGGFWSPDAMYASIFPIATIAAAGQLMQYAFDTSTSLSIQAFLSTSRFAWAQFPKSPQALCLKSKSLLACKSSWFLPFATS